MFLKKFTAPGIRLWGEAQDLSRLSFLSAHFTKTQHFKSQCQICTSHTVNSALPGLKVCPERSSRNSESATGSICCYHFTLNLEITFPSVQGEPAHLYQPWSSYGSNPFSQPFGAIRGEKRGDKCKALKVGYECELEEEETFVSALCRHLGTCVKAKPHQNSNISLCFLPVTGLGRQNAPWLATKWQTQRQWRGWALAVPGSQDTARPIPVTSVQTDLQKPSELVQPGGAWLVVPLHNRPTWAVEIHCCRLRHFCCTFHCSLR